MSTPLETAKAALERFHDVRVDDDGALSFAHGGVVAFVQGTELEDGLPVLNLTCVVAWDLPFAQDVPARVGLGVGESLFGMAGVIAAPVFYAYLKSELAAQGLLGKPPLPPPNIPDRRP